MLAKFYNHVNKDGKKFEVAFVSRDKSEAEYKSYYSEHPWLTIGFSD